MPEPIKKKAKKALQKSKAAGGRQKGSIGAKNNYARNEYAPSARVSQGYNKVLEELVTAGHFKSMSDVMHEALYKLAKGKLPETFYWLNKIQ